MKNQLILEIDKDVQTGINLAKVFVGLTPVPILNVLLSSGMGFINEKIAAKRLNILLNMLENSEIDIEDEIIQNEDFIHGISIVLNAVMRTNKTDKIRYFSNLLAEGLKNCSIIEDIEGFEYFVKLLDSVTYTELVIVEAIYEVNDSLVLLGDDKNTPEELVKIALNNIKKYIEYEDELLLSILDKLLFTGLIQKIQVHSFTYGTSKTRYYYQTSILYEELKKRITIAPENS